jgi:hypothetical protein
MIIADARGQVTKSLFEVPSMRFAAVVVLLAACSSFVAADAPAASTGERQVSLSREGRISLLALGARTVRKNSWLNRA